MSTNLYSHPNITLATHLEGVFRMGLHAFDGNGLYPEYRELMKLILLLHDLGKASSFFQAYLMGTSHTASKYTRHSEVSAIIAYQFAREGGYSELESTLVYNAIRCHHGSLDNFREMQEPDLTQEEIKTIANGIDARYLNACIGKLLIGFSLTTHKIQNYLETYYSQTYTSRVRRLRKSLSSDLWFLQRYLYSMLIWADKCEAIFHESKPRAESMVWQGAFVNKYRKSLKQDSSELGEIRTHAYETLSKIHTTQRVLSISLPTGAGKTISSLRSALSLIETDKPLQRIVYCLPFTSIIDQNHAVFKDILALNHVQADSSILLAHHHLTEYQYLESENKYEINQSEFLIETWDSEFVITTFYQIVATLFSSSNKDNLKFHRLANSILILDEVQSIPHKYWLLFKSHLRELVECLNLRLIMVTATMPLIFDEQKHEIMPLIPDSEFLFARLNRIVLHPMHARDSLDIEGFVKLLREDIASDCKKSRLIIVNTIKTSLALFKRLQEENLNSPLLYLSSNVIPKDRLARIKAIRERNADGSIVVSTQVVEAGVDIDFDVVYRDLAPLDCIIQACGRCNRNQSRDRGIVKLIRLKDARKDYWQYIYDPTLIDATLNALKPMGKAIEESDFHALIQGYYQDLITRASSALSQDIIAAISGLSFTDVDHQVKLIDSNTMPVFVELDQEAGELLEAYKARLKEVCEDDYIKKARIKSAFKKLSPYMINVHANMLKCDDAFYIIDREMLHNMYDAETGFKREPQIQDGIF